MNVHATCIAIDNTGVLLRGPSGSGKSDLALRMMDAGAALVSDDYVALSAQGDDVLASPPPTIEGLIEVRGLGLVTVPFLPQATIRLVVDLVDRDDVPRLPDPEDCHATLLTDTQPLPLLYLNSFEASAPEKIRLGIYALAGGNLRTKL